MRLRAGRFVCAAFILETRYIASLHSSFSKQCGISYAQSIDLLMETVIILGNLPELPTCDRFEPLLPEGNNIDLDNEVVVDPNQIGYPLDASNTNK